MSQSVISVEHLSKAYRIGVREEIPDTLMGAMKNAITAPWKNFKRLRRLNTSTDSPIPNPSSTDTLWALRDVSFEINQGDVVGIIGRNGAGKSTLLKILSRITEPTSGRVVIRGRVSSLLEVGTGFHPELTGRENVYMNGTILGMRKKEIDRKFEEIVDFSGVEKFLDTPTKRYSSGMQVRLAFAVAAHLEPEILLIDEVLAVGDVEFQRKCIGKMSDVASSGRTILFVSHNMTAVDGLCTRGVCLAEGAIARIGTSQEAILQYLSSATHKSHSTEALKRPSIHLGQKLRIVEVRPLAKQPTGFPYDGPLVFEVKIRATEPIADDLRFGITVYSERRGPLLSTFVPINNQLDSNGTHAFRLCFSKTHIAPGNYGMSISVGTGTDQTTRKELDVVMEAASFEVMPFSQNSDKNIAWNATFGEIRFPPEFVAVEYMQECLLDVS
ncbi:MAG TPA: polysaccharide/polyol phosphate ABC transporter ATP-binding protein [Planctomycetaceae bacterium]|nr:polysaccharide/polyol phosphate ABC transporter ATP-binding protein [Planctomycetaceae bacterium]